LDLLNKRTKGAHVLMLLLLMIWGLEYVAAKWALAKLDIFTLIGFKYILAIMLIGTIKFASKTERKNFIRKKDIPVFITCAIAGEIFYYFCEYEAMDYMPVSLITMILAFVPAVSVVTEKLLYKRSPTMPIIAGIIMSVLGIALIIGADFRILFQGRIIGYILCAGAVLSWNLYNFVTDHLSGGYGTITIAFNQILCTLLLTFPYMISHLPAAYQLTPRVVGGVLFIGILSAGIGFMIYVYSLSILKPTTMAVYSNFLPVTTTIFGWLILGEMISPLQILGGVVVISAGYIVIREKGKLEGPSNDRET